MLIRALDRITIPNNNNTKIDFNYVLFEDGKKYTAWDDISQLIIWDT
jgi:hypothetical protein